MDGQLLFILAVHEAGHWVAAEQLGGNPKEVVASPDTFTVRSRETDSAACDLVIAAAGYAAERIILGRTYGEDPSDSDSEAIKVLGRTVEEAVNLAVIFLERHEFVVMSIALAIEGAVNRGQEQITADELRPYYELAQTVSANG